MTHPSDVNNLNSFKPQIMQLSMPIFTKLLFLFERFTIAQFPETNSLIPYAE